MMNWLQAPFGRPDQTRALRAAQIVRAESPQLAGGFEVARSYLESTGLFAVETRNLGISGGSYSGLTSVTDGKFRILLDPRPHFPSRYSDDHQAALEISFRLAHEIGHTLFYRCSPGRAPVRARRVDAEEESFCDLFAAHLLLADARAILPTAEKLVAIAESRAIPRWVVAKAYVSASNGAVAEWSRAGRLLWVEESGPISVPQDLNSALLAPYDGQSSGWSFAAMQTGILAASSPMEAPPKSLVML